MLPLRRLGKKSNRSLADDRACALVLSFVEQTNRRGFEWARETEDRLVRPSQILENVERGEVDASGIRTEVFTPPSPRGSLLYLHGGGFTIGSPATYANLVAKLAVETRRCVFAPDYRLAPEHPFPAAHEDCLAVLNWLVDRGDAEHLILAGDSAGGNLALGIALLARDQGLELPRCLLLFSPWLDLGCRDDESIRSSAAKDCINVDFLAACQKAVAPTDQLLEALEIATIDAELRELPKTVISVGEDEILLEQALELASKLRVAGVEVDLLREPGLFHTFQNHWESSKACQLALARAVDRLPTLD